MEFQRSDTPSSETSPEDICVVIRRRDVLVKDLEASFSFPCRCDLAADTDQNHRIGTYGGQACFAVSFSEDADMEGWIPLRSLLAGADEHIVAAAMTAAQVLDWDRDTAYCGRCGVATVPNEEVRSKTCPECGRSLFPRISPAVIVAVTRHDKILLGHNKRHAGEMFSTIAGFVEPGENLEDAVRREVHEEISLEVENITYFGSQPWPFPDSLMIGFTATSERGDIEVDGEEIVEARWFSRDAMPTIPPHGTISRKLIDAFLTASE